MTSKSSFDRWREHAERMLARAEKQERQAAKLVEKWKRAIAELDRIGVDGRQATLWIEEHSSEGRET